MPLYLCRWENGDCSFIWALNKEHALEVLDEVGNAEGCPITPISDFSAHFRLTDEGDLALESFGEVTEEVIFEKAYPILDDAMLNAPADQTTGELTAEGRALVRKAVVEERKRVRPKNIKEPETELGREIKKGADLATHLVDRTVREQAERKLKRFQGGGKPN
ncbi:MAG: hypothetical protein V3T65_00890 [Acidobacteriota bacterium]